MAIMSAKNKLTPGTAAADLGVGLGDQLISQVQTEIQARQKQKPKGLVGNQNQNPYNVGGLSMAAQSLGLNASMPR